MAHYWLKSQGHSTNVWRKNISIFFLQTFVLCPCGWSTLSCTNHNYNGTCTCMYLSYMIYQLFLVRDYIIIIIPLYKLVDLLAIIIYSLYIINFCMLNGMEFPNPLEYNVNIKDLATYGSSSLIQNYLTVKFYSLHAINPLNAG